MSSKAITKVQASIVIAIIVIAVIAGAAYYVLMPAPPAKPKELTFSSGVTGGTWAVGGASMAEIITNNVPGAKVTSIPGNPGENLIRLEDNTAQLGFTYVGFLKAGIAGGKLADVKILDKATSNVRGILKFEIVSPMTIVIRKDIDVKTFGEIIEKKMKLRWATYQPGSNELNLQILLKSVYGLAYSDLKTWGGSLNQAPADQTSMLMKDGLADIYAGTLGVPTGWITEVMQTGKFKLLPVEDSAIQKMGGFGFSAATIKAGAYPGTDKDVPSFAENTCIVVRADLSNDMVYSITKTLLEEKNRKTVETAVKIFKMDPANSWKGLEGMLHPGAEKYYKEAGYMK